MTKIEKIILTIGATMIIAAWLIMMSGCSTPTQKQLDEPGHWPGWIVEPPMYGPHDLQVQLRNAYSDGWQDRGRANEQ